MSAASRSSRRSRRFLERFPHGLSAVVIEGQAGIGKTTVWLEAVRLAEERDLRVLRARPAESEADLSYAALADLVGAAFDETRSSLPAVQERALASALLRAEPGAGADGRLTGTALVSLLAVLAEREPVLVAIDDVQWLDPATEQALTFAFRRLPPQLGLLLARRAEPGGELPLGLSRALPDESLERIAPQPLSLAALYQLVKSRLEVSFPRPVLIRLAEATDGNPFFAIELARAYASRPGRARSRPAAAGPAQRRRGRRRPCRHAVRRGAPGGARRGEHLAPDAGAARRRARARR